MGMAVNLRSVYLLSSSLFFQEKEKKKRKISTDPEVTRHSLVHLSFEKRGKIGHREMEVTNERILMAINSLSLQEKDRKRKEYMAKNRFISPSNMLDLHG